jgi:hypothetical protein
MTFNKRGISLRDRWSYSNPLARFALVGAVVGVLALVLALLTACRAPVEVSDQIEGCPNGYRHVDLEGGVMQADGTPAEGRTFTVTLAAASFDPEYQGILVDGVGVTGHNPYVTVGVTDGTEGPDDWHPVICHPADRGVVIMIRHSFQHPSTAYMTIECGLNDRGIVGLDPAGQPLGGPLGHNPTALGTVAFDQARVELADMLDPEAWYVAQCDYVYLPDGYSGPPLTPFPRLG